MHKVQQDQFDMMLSVTSFLKEHQEEFSSSTPLMASFGLLNTKMEALQNLYAFQIRNNSGATIDKKEDRQGLETMAFVISSACASYAAVWGDVDFKTRTYYTKSKLLLLSDAVLVGVCVSLHQEATARLRELSSYNVSQEQLQVFQQKMQLFSNQIPVPTELKSKKARATKEIAVLIGEIRKVIKERLDNDIIAFQLSQPHLVALYFQIRKITNTGVTQLSLMLEVVSIGSQECLAGVLVELVDEKITRKTGITGCCRFKNLKDGSHKLRVSCPNYETQVLNIISVKGETKRLKVALEPQN
jgi:hypothetical protein